MKERLYWVDNARAAAMISMVLYHAIWDLVYLYGMDWPWYRSDLAFIWQQSICWTFILLSGFCWSFSRNPLKQGLIVSAGGILVTIVTLLFSYHSRIVFGVLNLIGASALLLVPLKKVFEKIPAGTGLVFMFLTFAVTYGVNDRYLGFLGMELIELPENLYENLFTTFLGFPDRLFFSADYFSLLPWVFLYFAGYFLHRLWAEGKLKMPDCCNIKVPILSSLGRKSLIIYMLHQPIIYGMLQLVFCSCNKL